MMSPLRPSVKARELVEALILDRHLQPGDRLPAERELCEELAVSRSTLRAALRRLESEGRLIRRHGSGNVVVDKLTRNLRDLTPLATAAENSGHVLTTVSSITAVVPAPNYLADLLGLAPHEHLVKIRRVRALDTNPATVETSWLPHGRFEGLEAVDFNFVSLYEALEHRFGTTVQDGYERLAVEQSPQEISGCLERNPGTPLFHVRGLARDCAGRPVEAFDSWLRPDLIRFASLLENQEKR